MKCEYCGSEMRLDDEDFNFKGNHDDYYVCDKCGGSCVVKVRYGTPVKTTWEEGKSWEKENHGRREDQYIHAIR